MRVLFEFSLGKCFVSPYSVSEPEVESQQLIAMASILVEKPTQLQDLGFLPCV